MFVDVALLECYCICKLLSRWSVALVGDISKLLDRGKEMNDTQESVILVT